MKPFKILSVLLGCVFILFPYFSSAYTRIRLPKHNNPDTLTSPSGEVEMKVAPSHNKILSDSQEPVYLLITLQTPKQENTKKLPLNLAIVIDRSGSMAEKNKLNFAKEAAKQFIRKLDNEDRVCLVEYDDKVSIMTEPVLVGSQRDELLRKIDLLEPRGSTNLAGGMMQGVELLQKNLEENRINRVLLLSDGLANTGIVGLNEVGNLSENTARKGIQISTFGLGADFDEEMMTRISDSSGGNYYFIESAAQASGIFDKERLALSTVTGKNVSLYIETSDQVSLDDVVGYTYKKKGNEITVDLPDLYSGQNRKILLKLKPKIKEGGSVKVADVSLSYKSTAHDLELRGLTQDISLESTKNKDEFEKSANSPVVAEVAKITSAAQTIDAMKRYKSGDKTGAKSLLNNAKSSLQNSYNSTGNPALLEQIKDIDKATGNMDSYAPDSEEGKLLIKGEGSKARDNQKSY